MGINIGLRISDILSINVGDVKNRSYIKIIGKKTHKYKKIPINLKLKYLLKNFVKNRNNDEPLFFTQRKKRLDRIQAYKVLKVHVQTLD